MEDVFRQPTDKEKKEMILLDPQGGKYKETPLEVFRKELSLKEQEYTKAHKPFCRRCALIEFQDQIKKTMSEAERTVYGTTINDYKITIPDLEVYGKSDRFIVKEETDAVIQNARTGHVLPTKIGIHRDYECKIRKCGISVYLSNEDLKKEVK